MKRVCKQCGAEFTLTEREIAFYKSKNLHLPKRCEKCRRENKKKAEITPVPQTVKPYHGKEDSRIKRYVAAAVVCMLLAAGIGVSRAGWFSEQATPNGVRGADVETGADLSAADMPDEQTEISRETAGAPAGMIQDEQPENAGEMTDKVQDAQPWTSGEAEDVLLDMPQRTPEDIQTAKTEPSAYTYSFRKTEYLQEHFEKHGAEFGYASADEYLAGANRVAASPEALHKLEAEDGDDVYYLESTNEFVIVSTDGYLRTYFKPSDGKAYFDRQ